MTYIISFCLATVNYFNKNKKTLYWLSCIFLWLLMGWCANNADTLVYKLRYENPYNLSTEPMFLLLIQFCKQIGLSFSEYRIVLTGIFLFILFLSIYKSAANYNLALLLYFIFPYFFDAVQLRQFTANSIVIVAILVLQNTDWSKAVRIIGFVGLTLLSASLHASSVLMFSMLLVLIPNMLIFAVTLAAGIAAELILLSPKVLLLLGSLFGISNRMESILSRYSGMIYQRYVLSYIIVGVGAVLLLYYEKRHFRAELTEREQNNIMFVIKCHITAAMGFVLVMKGFHDFIRMQFPLLILSYIRFSSIMPVKSINSGRICLSREKGKFCALCIAYAFLILYIWILSNGNIDSVLRSVMENNIIIP